MSHFETATTRFRRFRWAYLDTATTIVFGCRSAPVLVVLGRSKVDSISAPKLAKACLLIDAAAPGDGRTSAREHCRGGRLGTPSLISPLSLFPPVQVLMNRYN